MSNTLALNSNTMPVISEQSLDSYLHRIKNIPILSAQDEQQLAHNMINNGDLEAARKLVMSHLRFVLYIAQGYRGYGLSESDLIQEGDVGLMKAVKRFDPLVGVRLVSFAVHWIRAEIHDFILRNWRIVKVVTTKAQRKLFFKLRSMKKRMGWLSQNEAEYIAKDLGVSHKDVLEMEKRLSALDVSFDAPTDNEDDNFSPSAYIEDRRYDPAILVEQDNWDKHGHFQLKTALEQLDVRSQDILQQRWLNEDKTTLKHLGEHYKVSAERIRQIENNAIKKLKKYIKLDS